MPDNTSILTELKSYEQTDKKIYLDGLEKRWRRKNPLLCVQLSSSCCCTVYDNQRSALSCELYHVDLPALISLSKVRFTVRNA